MSIPMAEGVVFDLGYRPHDGPRLGRAGARRALFGDGLRRVFGIRRRARRKALPFVLVAIALLPAMFFVAVGVVAGELDPGATFFGHAQYFDLTGTVALLFVALAAGELLVPDRIHGTLAVYASRPLTTSDYLVGRAAALAAVVFSFLWLPHLVLYLGRAWVSPAGFGSYAADHLADLWETAAASAVYLAALAPLAFVLATLSRTVSVSAGAFLAVVTISGPTTGALVDADFRFLGAFALQHHPGYVKDWILGTATRAWVPERAGFDPALSLTIIAAVAVASAALVAVRYRRAVP
jgi:ABC-2 type transport system permease protein